MLLRVTDVFWLAHFPIFVNEQEKAFFLTSASKLSMCETITI